VQRPGERVGHKTFWSGAPSTRGNGSIAGRGARGNAVYRDLVRSSLIVDQRFLVLGVMRSYRHQSSGRSIIVSSYRDSKDQLDALYASGRLRLPFEGVLLFGY
jgi:hypothetical protein